MATVLTFVRLQLDWPKTLYVLQYCFWPQISDSIRTPVNLLAVPKDRWLWLRQLLRHEKNRMPLQRNSRA